MKPLSRPKILGLGHPMNAPQDGYWANGQVPDGKVPKYSSTPYVYQ